MAKKVFLFVISFLLVSVIFSGVIISDLFFSQTLEEEIKFLVYLPDEYENTKKYYSTIFLLHGRGDSFKSWVSSLNIIDGLIKEGIIPPIIAVIPDVPYHNRASYYIDSLYGDKKYLIETALNNDLINYIEREYRVIKDRRARMIVGYSMGGYGALRYILTYPNLYSSAILLSPAVYYPLPPIDSSTREFGAFGKDDELFLEEIYLSKNYPQLQEHYESFHLNSKIFIMVGDDEWQSSDYTHDLDYEAHTLYKHLQKFKGIDAELRIIDGGHDWSVWNKGFEEGLKFIKDSIPYPSETKELESIKSNYKVLDIKLYGTNLDDYAGGIAKDPLGNIYLALNLKDGFDYYSSIGKTDIYIISLNPHGELRWITQLGTKNDDRAYQLICVDEDIYITGYTKGSLENSNYENNTDDLFVAKIDNLGNKKWIKQLGDEKNADRGYAIGNFEDLIFVAGYTKGSPVYENAGDKDILIYALSKEGNLIWSDQFGGIGEEKVQDLTVDDKGNVYLTGLTSSNLEKQKGSYDIFLVSYNKEGSKRFVSQIGTENEDQAFGITYMDDRLFITGCTTGDFGTKNNGEKDIILIEADLEGTLLSVKQLGTSGNDKGTKFIHMDDSKYIIGITDGIFVKNQGKFDIVIIEYNDEVKYYQIGTIENDGADEWAEPNMYCISDDQGNLLILGITFGESEKIKNMGSSDIFFLKFSPN